MYDAAKELGIRIPDDIDIICFGDSDASSFLSPSLSVIRQPAYELGARGMQVMLETLASADATLEQHVVLPTQLVLRETCIGVRETNLASIVARTGS